MAANNNYERDSVGLFFYPGEQGLGVEHPDIIARSLDCRLKDTLIRTHTALRGQLGTVKPKEWLISVIPASMRCSLVGEFQEWNEYSENAIRFPDVFEDKEVGSVWLPVRELYYSDSRRQSLVAFPTVQNGRTPLTLNQMREVIPIGYQTVLAGTFDLPGWNEGTNYYAILTRYAAGDPRSCLRQLAFLGVLNRRLLETGQYLKGETDAESSPDRLGSEVVIAAPSTNGHNNGGFIGRLKSLAHLAASH